MGELHIEIIKERIRSEYKIDVDVGELQIAYKETIRNEMRDEFEANHKIGTTNHNVKVVMSVIPNGEKSSPENPVLLIDKSKDCVENTSKIHPKVMKAVVTGMNSVFLNGPKIGCPVINVAVKLHRLEVGKYTSPTIVSSAIAHCVKKVQYIMTFSSEFLYFFRIKCFQLID